MRLITPTQYCHGISIYTNKNEGDLDFDINKRYMKHLILTRFGSLYHSV